MREVMYTQEKMNSTSAVQMENMMAAKTGKITEVKDLTVFRGDKRTAEEIEEAGGFYPSGGNRHDRDIDWIGDARSVVTQILNKDKGDIHNFVFAWKHGDPYGELEGLFKGLRGMHAGVCCGITGEQKGGATYEIKVPVSLCMIKVCEGMAGGAAVIYGDAGSVEESNILAMQLLEGLSAEEFAFLTPVPIDWISLCKFE